jgi:hypothetical protein
MIYLDYINTLFICSIAYLVIGVIIFCYMLIEELQNAHTAIDARPESYFIYCIEDIIIILNILCGICRITGSIMIIILITIDAPNDGNAVNNFQDSMVSNSFVSEEKDVYDMSYSLPKKDKIPKRVDII